MNLIFLFKILPAKGLSGELLSSKLELCSKKEQKERKRKRKKGRKGGKKEGKYYAKVLVPFVDWPSFLAD
jgi:hypothetical protein